MFFDLSRGGTAKVPDNALYKEAREKLYSEIGYVLGIDSYDEIENLIKSKLNFC